MKYFLVVLLVLSASIKGICQNADTAKVDKKTTLAKPVDEVEERIAYLEQEGKVYDKFFDKLEGMTSSFSTYLAWLSIFLAFVSAVMLVFQIAATRRDSKAMEDMRSSYIASMKAQEDNNKKLLDFVTINIQKTSDFIGSYENLIKIKQASEEVNNRIALIDKKEKERIDYLIIIQKKLNGKALRLMESVFKVSYGSTFFDNSELKKFDSFFIEANTHYALVNENPVVEKYWNGSIDFIMGLSQFLSNQPIDTEKNLKSAIEKIAELEKSPPTVEDMEILFPDSDLYSKHGGKENWNKKLKNKCNFYLGLMTYRQGRFKDSTKYFMDSLSDFPNDIDSIFYLFQARYWGNQFNNKLSILIEDITTEITNAIQMQTELDRDEAIMINARLLTKIGDFCLNITKSATTDKSPKDSTLYYNEGYRLIQEVNGNLQNIPKRLSQVVPLNYFGFAKSVQKSESNETNPKLTHTDLYRQAKLSALWVIGSIENKETRYILRYIVSYCHEQLGESEDAIKTIDLAIEDFKEYYAHVDYFGYSPISNTMQSKSNLENEILEYRKSLLNKTTGE
jgi:tetratricopeptide (TPR) repeat protein